MVDSCRGDRIIPHDHVEAQEYRIVKESAQILAFVVVVQVMRRANSLEIDWGVRVSPTSISRMITLMEKIINLGMLFVRILFQWISLTLATPVHD